jgi:threonine synthase
MPFRPRYTGLIDKYRDRLPVHDDTRVISLGEGNTPLIRLNNIPRETGKAVDIYVKYEGLNPTGSFKDRGMTMQPGGHLCVNRQYVGVSSRLCGPCRHHGLRADSGGQDRAG